MVIQALFALADQLRAAQKSIKEVVVFDDDELTEDRVLSRLKEVVGTIEEIERLNKKLGQLRTNATPFRAARSPRDYRRYNWVVE